MTILNIFFKDCIPEIEYLDNDQPEKCVDCQYPCKLCNSKSICISN